jgi:hypothetical protein
MAKTNPNRALILEMTTMLVEQAGLIADLSERDQRRESRIILPE